MSRSNPSRRVGEYAEHLHAVQAIRDRKDREQQWAKAALQQRFHSALAKSGQAAAELWQRERAALVAHGLLAPDLILTPSAWTPQPAPALYPEPLPPTPTAVEAARVAAELLGQRPPMTEEDHAALGVYIARLGLLYREVRW
ncbi:hypothetical protein HNQ07_004229 [Deinococcus metalli]|uniref:Uncharacterized protein n=1 Tax=Deinococcus metalli TaxID=1141878 RepID=A0A7W8KIH6_9DEIO|nr:hypothetical protein [Deinococcus metalli]MBB5378722.1 hypothetical protein [Deinococcus metalli]GHF60423.1 hypothetical protein GCM10017781_40760 [Deinococcus metalli]